MTDKEAIQTYKDWVKRDSEMEHADRLENIELYKKAIQALEQTPKTGRWVKTPYGDIKCSICDNIFPQLPISYFEPKYCFNCGADMRGDDYAR